MTTTRWKVVPNTNGYCIHEDDKAFDHVVDINNKPLAEQIVREHNAFAAMVEALERIAKWTSDSQIEDWAHAALRLAKGG